MSWILQDNSILKYRIIIYFFPTEERLFCPISIIDIVVVVLLGNEEEGLTMIKENNISKEGYDLLPQEKIILRNTSVKHGLLSAFTNTLILTNQALIVIHRGMLGNIKDFERFPLETITHARVGETKNDEKLLEVILSKGLEKFIFKSDDLREYMLWALAITDHLSAPEREYYDYNYYQRILNDDFDDDTDEEINSKKGLQLDSRFVGDVAKSVLMSGNITPVGIVKGVSKATKKQIRRNATKGIGEKIKDELGLTDLEDEFTEMGNELREEFGLKPKMTHKMEREQQIHDAFNETVKKARKEVLLRSSIVARERINSYKFCPFCGTKISSDKVKYCTECGEKLD